MLPCPMHGDAIEHFSGEVTSVPVALTSPANRGWIKVCGCLPSSRAIPVPVAGLVCQAILALVRFFASVRACIAVVGVLPGVVFLRPEGMAGPRILRSGRQTIAIRYILGS